MQGIRLIEKMFTIMCVCVCVCACVCVTKVLHPGCIKIYLTYMQNTSCKMLGWMKHKLEWRLPGEIPIISDTRWHHPYGRKWRRTKEPLDESERGEWKSWLKPQHSKNWDHGIQSHHSMQNRWTNNGNSDEALFSWAPKSLQMVTAVMKLKDACSLEEKLWAT